VNAPVPSALSVQGLGLTIGGATILQDVDLAVDAGSLIGVIGPNGAGKTTLFNAISGLMRPTSGSISMDGRDITAMSVPARARAGLGRTFQTSSNFPRLSVLENVAFWAELSGAGGMSASDALSALGIGHLSDLPARYLSAGQRRRVNLTRALTSGARLWLLDEPTTALDASTTQALTGLIDRHLESGGLAVISTHTDLGLRAAGTLMLGAAA